MGGATTSSPELFGSNGRPDPGAAVARTEELYRRHWRLVGGLCRALLRDQAEAEDAAQQTFLSAHRALVNGSSPEEPAAWLATIARNECWARIRNRMREPLPTAEVDRESSSSDPLAEAIRNADLAAMWSAIAQLPRQQREALLLREFGGLSYEELAGALAVSDSAVESLLFRARQGVRTRLKTAYAGVAGASWLESLARLAGGLGGGMAPVAAKVAVVGVGAAVATGGAVVGPQMIEHARRSPHPTVPVHAKAKTQQAVVQVVQPVAPIDAVRRAPAVTTASLRVSAAEEAGSRGKNSSHDDGSSLAVGRSSSGDNSSGGEDHASHSEKRKSQSGDRSTTSDDARETDSSASSDSSVESATHQAKRDDAPHRSEHPAQPDPPAQPDQPAQPEGGSAPADGGVTASTTIPVVTVTAPTGDAPPAVGVPGQGDG